MTQLPHFLNPANAAIAAAIVVPALLVLYFLKLRRREMPVPSTLLWRKAIQDLQVNAPFQKLRRNLLLLLQLLLLIFLLLSLSRPVLNYTPGAGARTIILIDRSASMSANDMPHGRTRLEEAKRRADDLVATLRRNDMAMVIAFDDSAEIVQKFTSDPRVLRNALAGIEQTQRKTRLEEAYRLADAQTLLVPGQETASGPRPDVWLYSDGRAADANTVSVHANLHFDAIGTDTAKNIAIVAMNAKRDYTQPTQVQVFARFANYGPDPAIGVPVQMTVDGQVRSAGTVTLLPERWTDAQRDSARENGLEQKDSIEFAPMDLLSSAVIKVEHLATEGDALPADDSATVVVPPPKILAVLLVTDGNFFLEHGLRSQKLKIFDTIVPPEYKQRMAGDGLGKVYDVIVFDHYDPETLPPTGAFVYFDCVPPKTELKPALDPQNNRVITTDNTVLDWNRDHPILRHMSISELYAKSAIKLEPTLNSQVLVQGNNGPLMVLHREARAMHLVVPFDLVESNWPLRPSFPLFLFQMMQFMSLGAEMDLRPSYAPGTALQIPRIALEKLDSSTTSITLDGPMGRRRIPIPSHGDFVLPALNKVGVYTTDPPIPQYETIAVNLLDANESNLQPTKVAPGADGQSVPVGSDKQRLELWWYLAAAAIPLLLIEWWVYTRRVHL